MGCYGRLVLVLTILENVCSEERNVKRTWSIGHYGAKAGKEKYGKRNGEALGQALLSALPGGTVIVPENHIWYVVPQMICEGIANNVTLQIDGVLAASSNIDEWPLDWGGNDYMPLLKVTKSHGFSVTGKGAIDGQGHKWWWAFLLDELPFKRPVLLEIDESENVQVTNLALLDAPRFNVFLGSYTQGALIKNLTILVDWKAQLDMMKEKTFLLRNTSLSQSRALAANIPVFPFNTDGIDVAGTNILIEDCVVSNFDDVIAIKPAERKYTKTKLPDSFTDWNWCTRNVVVRNLTTLFGAGISVGSVHPSNLLPCVQNVTFSNTTLYYPLKAIYVKPDLKNCDSDSLPCAAFIADVSYSNINIYQGTIPEWWSDYEYTQRNRGTLTTSASYHDTSFVSTESLTCGNYDFFCMMWPLYLGTQQQLEPDGEGSGIWPQTEPLVTVTNISFINVTAKGGSWPEAAAAIRCNASNPCTGIHFENIDIQADHFFKGHKFICSDEGTIFGSIHGLVSPNASTCVLPDAAFA